MVLITILSLFSFNAAAQSKWVFEHYNYIRQPDEAVFVPMFHFETEKKWYAEVRYNYEDAGTVSLFAGKSIVGGNELSYTVTPMVGYSLGRFTGASLATNFDAEWKNFYLSAQSQYSAATKKDITNFFFNWSEIGYSISDHFFTGLAMQYTLQDGLKDFQPGLLAGLNFKGISFPVYVFSPFDQKRYFIVGLNYEYNFKKKS
jgi:hypothetical protein